MEMDLTSSRYQLHRVLLPPPGDISTRQSLAFFVQPDDDAVIRCCDGSDKYPPVSSGVYLQQRLQLTYKSTQKQPGNSDDQSRESSGGTQREVTFVLHCRCSRRVVSPGSCRRLPDFEPPSL